MNASRWISLGFLAVAIVSGAGMWLQHATRQVLQGELELLRYDQQTLTRLRAEHTRLAAERVPEQEVARLRADHAALLKLRREIEEMQARTIRPAR